MQFGLLDWLEASRRAPGELYEHKLEPDAASDQAGVHCFFMSVHQGTPRAIDVSPVVLLSARFQRTRRLRPGFPYFSLLRHHPSSFYH